MSDDLIWIGPNCSADGQELGDVKPPLPEFEFRHECLALPETLAKLDLCYARVLSSLHKQFDYSPVKLKTK